MRLSVRSDTAAPRLRAAARFLLLATMVIAGSACDAAQRARKAITADGGDPVWRGDSTALAAHPEVLFRVTRDSTGRRVVPLATLGPRGFRLLSLGDRGWRALDLAYLQSGQTLRPYRAGASQPAVPSTRGMWEGAPLDTIAGCSVLLPGGLADLPAGVEFVTSAPRPPLKPVTPLAAGELQTAIDAIPLLIAPAVGVPMAMMPRYARSVYVAATGNGPRPTVIVVYDDPEVVSDTIEPTGQRPRHLVVVLDQGVYGYKPTYTYSTLGSRRTPPRLRYLDHLDTDGDGASELFFGITNKGATLYTIILRYGVDAWRELLRHERQRCHR